MRFIKCPRCELNYIPEDEEYCPVCKREIKGERQEDPIELCSICNENPVMPGRDVCIECYKELTQQQNLVSGSRRGDSDDDLDMEEAIESIDLSIQDADSTGDMRDHLSLEDEQDKELAMDDDEDDRFEN